MWCEQQFQYSLERGFRRQTPAMAAGTKIHKVLEEQVHTTVPVEITTREDAFGLRLFNMIQGLLSLEQQGVTRELAVFGYLDGVLVQGVIDEITYVDPGATTTAAAAITPLSKTAFITDTKTRSSTRVPGPSQMRSTALQLMLYHRLLTLLPAVPFDAVLAHNGLDGATGLPDRFIAQVACVGGISLDVLLANNSLRGLWRIVLRQLEKAVPSVGDTVGVVIRAQSSGEVMARRAWPVDPPALEAHLQDTMKWWRGERPSVGVQIEDAWKCGWCDFQETCVWRLGQIDKLAQEMRSKKEGAKPRLKKMKLELGEAAGESGSGSGSGSDSGSASPRKRRKKSKTEIPTEPDASEGDDEKIAKHKVRAKRKAKEEDPPA